MRWWGRIGRFILTIGVLGKVGLGAVVIQPFQEGGKVHVRVDVVDLAIDLGGFGADDPAIAPEAIGDFADEIFLEDGFGFEFLDKG